MKNTYEVADIFRIYGKEYREQNILSYKKLKVMHKIEVCRTARLGGHVEQCDTCGFERIAYNSCRDRHCPKCQTMVKEKMAQRSEGRFIALQLFSYGFYHTT